MVLVEMRATAQAAKVAEATGGAHLLGKNDKDGKALLGHGVDIGTDFEACRAKIESVSVLFKLYEKGGTVPSWRFRLGGRSLEPYSNWSGPATLIGRRYRTTQPPPAQSHDV